MRILKKSLAMLLALTMIISVLGISVFADPADYTMKYVIKTTAEGTDGITATKAGKTVYVDVYATAHEYVALAVTLDKMISTVTVDDVTIKTDGATKNGLVNPAGTKVSLNYTSGVTVTADKPLATIRLTIPSDATGTVNLFEQIDYSYSEAVEDNCGTMSNPTIAITPSFTANAAKAVKDGAEVSTVEVGLGTTQEKALEGITATVTDGTNNEAGYAVSNWTVSPEYNAAVTGDYVFKGDVVIDGEGAANAGTLSQAVTVTVKVTPITDGTVAEAKGTVMVDAENGITEDTIKKALPATLDVSKGDFKDTFAVTWNTVEGYANEGKGYKADDVITVKGTLTSPSAKGLFTTTTTDVEGKVTVVPAEIEGGSISINNPIDNGYVTANITVPASEVAKMPKIEDGEDEAVKAAKKAKRTVLVTVESKKTDVEDAKGEYEFTNDDIDKAIAAVTAATAEKPADPITVPAIKVDKKMKELGYSSSGANKTFTVTVTVGGTQLVQKDKDGKVVPVSGEVKKATTGNAGGIHKGGSTTTTYAVTVVETKNGTATVSPEKAASGATVTVKPEPAEGYKVKSVTAVKADGTNVPVDEKAYTFTMPASAVKVTVEFEEGTEPVDPKPQEGKFVDVADDFWAAKDIYTLKDAGIIGGKSATEFDPEGDVTRAEFAKMVVGLFGYKATSDAVNFEDCKAEDWFTPYVAAGVEAGVIKGVSDTEFAPNATITREDACTILGRALNKVAQSNELKFTDADKVAEYAAPYVALLSELGYVNGYEDGSFAPTNNITRAEAAKIIAGIYNAKDSTEDKADNTDTIDVAPEK